jgi:hypothetical protein
MMAHNKNHTKHECETSKSSKYSIFYKEFHLGENAFSASENEKMTISHVVKIRNFYFIFEE